MPVMLFLVNGCSIFASTAAWMKSISVHTRLSQIEGRLNESISKLDKKIDEMTTKLDAVIHMRADKHEAHLQLVGRDILDLGHGVKNVSKGTKEMAQICESIKNDTIELKAIGKK